MIQRYGNFMHLRRGFDESAGQPLGDVPFDMAVDEPNSWVIGAEAKHRVPMVLHHDGIPFHRGRRDICKVAIEVAALGDRALQNLELMAVHMPGVQVAVVVVDDDLHDLAVLDDEGIYLTV